MAPVIIGSLLLQGREGDDPPLFDVVRFSCWVPGVVFVTPGMAFVSGLLMGDLLRIRSGYG